MTSENPSIKVYQFARSYLPIEGYGAIGKTLEDRPIEERCGVEDIDINARGLLVRASLDQVAEVMTQSGLRWDRNVYGQTLQGRGLFALQFRGHPWTGIIDAYQTDYHMRLATNNSNYENPFVSSYCWDWESQAQYLSQKLHARTIYYRVSDSNGSIGYACWDNGELMERLEYEDAIWQDTHDEALWEDTDDEASWEEPERTFEPHLFESKLRQLTAREIEDAYEFVDNFLCEQQAYATTRFSRFEIQREDCVRVDFIPLG